MLKNEDPVHQPLVGGANILKAKGHNLVTVRKDDFKLEGGELFK